MRIIDAEALKKQFGYTDEWYKSRTVAQIIDNAPIVTIAEWKAEMPSYIKEAMLDALRPNGEWTQEDHTDEMLNIWHCSNCKEDFCSEVGGHPKEWNYNFCPNCGAKMQNGGATDEP